MLLETAFGLIIVMGPQPSSLHEGWVRRKQESQGGYSEPWRSDELIECDFPVTTATAYMSTTPTEFGSLARLAAEIDSYRGVGDDWDGPGSFAPQPSHLDAAQLLAMNSPGGLPIPKPMLSSSGKVGLYWEGPGWMADAEIEDSSTASVFLGTSDRRIEELHEQVKLDHTVGDVLSGIFSVINKHGISR